MTVENDMPLDDQLISQNTEGAVIDNHGAWAIRDKHYRGWIGCFCIKAGCIEYVRDESGGMRLFITKEAALNAALWAHIDRQNAPRKKVEGAAMAVKHRSRASGGPRLSLAGKAAARAEAEKLFKDGANGP